MIYTNSVAEGRGEWLKEKAAEAGFTSTSWAAAGGMRPTARREEQPGRRRDLRPEQRLLREAQGSRSSSPTRRPGPASGRVAWATSGQASFWPIVRSPSCSSTTPTMPARTRPPGLDGSVDQGRFKGATRCHRPRQRHHPDGFRRHPDPLQDDTGELGITDEGWKQVKDYFENGSPGGAKTDLFARIASGDTDMGQMPSSIIAEREKSSRSTWRRHAVRRGAAGRRAGRPGQGHGQEGRGR